MASQAEQAQMQQEVQQMQMTMQVNEMMLKVTSVCFEKCIAGKPGRKLSYSEKECIERCTLRLLDSFKYTSKRMQGSLGGGQ